MTFDTNFLTPDEVVVIAKYLAFRLGIEIRLNRPADLPAVLGMIKGLGGDIPAMAATHYRYFAMEQIFYTKRSVIALAVTHTFLSINGYER